MVRTCVLVGEMEADQRLAKNASIKCLGHLFTITTSYFFLPTWSPNAAYLVRLDPWAPLSTNRYLELQIWSVAACLYHENMDDTIKPAIQDLAGHASVPFPTSGSQIGDGSTGPCV